jgi:hypothetical protein
VDLPFDDDVLDRVMLAMSRVCERVCEREGSLGIPFAMCRELMFLSSVVNRC